MPDYTELNPGIGGDKVIDEELPVITDAQGTTQLRKMPVSKIVLGTADNNEGTVGEGNPMPVQVQNEDLKQIRMLLEELLIKFSAFSGT